MSRISVIVPAWQAAATLGETLASIAAQSLAPDEIIVVDDGSTDATAAIACAVPNVRLLQQPNAGVAAACNAAVAVARGELVAFLDADDLWTEDCLAVHARHLGDDAGRDASVGWVAEFVCPTLPPDAAARFRPRPPQAGWLSGATMVRRTLIDRTGPFDAALRLGFWIDWVDRARRLRARFDVVDNVVLRRRLRPGSLGHQPARRRDLSEVARRALLRRRETPT